MLTKAKLFIPDTDLTRIKIHPSLNIICLIGKRSVIVASSSNGSLELIQRHLDEDKLENYMCCEFAELKKGCIIVVGGSRGVLKFLNLNTCTFEGYLCGHGGAITDIKSHFKYKNTIFSASEDNSIRMWNGETKKLMAIFGGAAGHKDFVLSMDISLCGQYLLSSGTDCQVKMWKIPDIENRRDLIETCYFPIYSTSNIHRSYITCVKFYGKLIVSKSVNNRISIVRPYLSVEIYDHPKCSYSSFINQLVYFESKFLTKKFEIFADTMIIGSESEKDVIYLTNLNRLQDGISSICKIKTDCNKKVRDIAIKNEEVYILFEESIILFMNIKNKISTKPEQTIFDNNLPTKTSK
ncbi:Embryonic ectoderm development [Hamiltosporidium tvaerminnensis]|nr:Embryonic ectoderm development [Hamiltosporidium tvaerminnensis]